MGEVVDEWYKADEVSISRFSFSHLHSFQQFIIDPQQLLEGIVVDHHAGHFTLVFPRGQAVFDQRTTGL